MRDGAIISQGPPRTVLSPRLLREAFGLDALVVEDPATGGPLIVPAAPAPPAPKN